jgi:hypothetical protein
LCLGYWSLCSNTSSQELSQAQAQFLKQEHSENACPRV